MNELHFSVKASQSAKRQALDVIKQIQASNSIPIERVQMRLRIGIPKSKEIKQVRENVIKLVSSVEEDSWSNSLGYELICLIDPGQYKPINELLQAECKGQAEVTVLSISDSREEESSFI
ncbi:hypothetical protein BB559_005215 [Furculomyces boomerangus]|uniref:Uncharacterized protein n=3 Tax=Harpellales TaxID=61421 RepID=A0A2T9YA14_9FUNG|nr:hypothetical protein BB559_005215 [Furculomyces boomerangus]PWA03125.1 hypothetical protein BB558_000692 [Smittium angustum]